MDTKIKCAELEYEKEQHKLRARALQVRVSELGLRARVGVALNPSSLT